MATSFRLETGTAANVMTTELNALANNTGAVATSAIDNSNLWIWADFELDVTYAVAPTANTGVDLYLLESVDGSNYTDGSSSILPPATVYVGTFPLRAVNTAQKITLPKVALPPAKWKALIQNNGTGQAFPATGTVLQYIPYRTQGV